MKILLNTDYLIKVVIDQVVNNATEWMTHERTKRWYDNLMFFTDYHFTNCKFEDRSDRLNLISDRLAKHLGDNIEIDGEEFDFIFKDYSK